MRYYIYFIDPTVGDIQGITEKKLYSKGNFEEYLEFYKTLMFPTLVFPYKNLELMKASYHEYLNEIIIGIDKKLLGLNESDFTNELIFELEEFIGRMKNAEAIHSDRRESISDLQDFLNYLVRRDNSNASKSDVIKKLTIKLKYKSFIENMSSLIASDTQPEAIHSLIVGNSNGKKIEWKSFKVAGCFLKEFVTQSNKLEGVGSKLTQAEFALNIARNSKIKGRNCSVEEVEKRILSPGVILPSLRKRIHLAVRILLENHK